MSEDKKYFPKGLFYNEPHKNAPDFVMGNVNIKVADFKAYLDKVKGDTLKLDLKISKDGKGYAEVNTYKPEKKVQQTPAEDDFDNIDDDLPF
jgi:hypothetical protein